MKHFTAYFDDGRASVEFHHWNQSLVESVAAKVRNQGGHIGWLSEVIHPGTKQPVTICVPED
jgi:hypothetical protein